MPRPRSERPYLSGPHKHRRRWRYFIYTPRGDGGRDRRVRSFETEQEAKTWARGFELVRAAAGRTIGDAVGEYLAALKRKGNKDGSIKTAGYRLNAILDQSRALVDLTPTRAQHFYDDLVDEGGAVDTHHGCLVAAKAFGRFCLDRKWLKVNAFASVEPVGRKNRGKEQMRVDEGRTFLSACFKAWRDDQDRSAIAAAIPLLMNLRASEVAQLVARDVDDRGRLLWIGEADSKTEAGRRRSLIPGVLQPALLALAASPVDEAGHLFAKEDGTAADRHWVSYHARRMMKVAGVRVVTTHGLRGTHSTFATVQGVTGEAVARSMGHTDPGMTQRHYIDQEAAADAQIQRVSDALSEEVTQDDGKDEP